jgi:hypothetical protein
MPTKNTGRDYPLSPTPAFRASSDTTPSGGMTRKEYREEMKQARFNHNIDAARKGTLASERIGKVKAITSIVGDVIGTAANAKSLIGGGNSKSGGVYKK